MPGRLDGRVVLVTGAAGTLGRSIADAIATDGGTPVRSDVAGRPDMDLTLDVTREEDWQTATRAIDARHGLNRHGFAG